MRSGIVVVAASLALVSCFGQQAPDRFAVRTTNKSSETYTALSAGSGGRVQWALPAGTTVFASIGKRATGDELVIFDATCSPVFEAFFQGNEKGLSLQIDTEGQLTLTGEEVPSRDAGDRDPVQVAICGGLPTLAPGATATPRVIP
jgi:hypothetical protein